MLSSLSYSLMAEQDLDEVLSIEKEVFPHPWTRDFFRLIIQDASNYILTLKKGKTIIGYGGYHLLMNKTNFLYTKKIYNSLIHLMNIAIRVPFQKHGFGTGLLSLLMNNAKTRNAEYCYLEVRPSNTKAFRFYRNYGFSVIGIIENYYPQDKENAIVMGMELTSFIET